MESKNTAYLPCVVGITYCCEKMIKWRSLFTVFDCNWTKVIAEPDGWHHSVTVTVLNIILINNNIKQTSTNDALTFTPHKKVSLWG